MCGSRKSSRACCSATTMAARPSGVKYRLYGSFTGIAAPTAPVRALIGTTASLLFSSTHKVVRSKDGTTCWGVVPRPVGKLDTTRFVAGSITVTASARPLGT